MLNFIQETNLNGFLQLLRHDIFKLPHWKANHFKSISTLHLSIMFMHVLFMTF